MERAPHYRPRVGRETRLLIATAFLALLALWMLARLRFPSPPPEPRGVADLLVSRASSAVIDPFADQIARVRAQVGGSLMAVEVADESRHPSGVSRAAFRLGGDVAVVHVPEGRRLRPASGVTVIAHNAASGLAVIRLPADPSPGAAAPRLAVLSDPPQYVVATSVYSGGVALRPVLIAATARADAPLWSASGFALPPDSGVAPGAFLFTQQGEFAGLTIEMNGSLGFVTAETVLDEANRLMADPITTPADLGIDVQALNPALSRALNAATGVVVTWVEPDGPSHGQLMARDVIETVDGTPVPAVEHWRRYLASVHPDTPLWLTIRRAGASTGLTVTATANGVAEEEDVPLPPRQFGAALRAVPGQGSEVVTVAPSSSAAAAGLLAGDIVTTIGTVTTPSPSQVERAVRGVHQGASLLLGIRRGEDHRLLVFEP